MAQRRKAGDLQVRRQPLAATGIRQRLDTERLAAALAESWFRKQPAAAVNVVGAVRACQPPSEVMLCDETLLGEMQEQHQPPKHSGERVHCRPLDAALAECGQMCIQCHGTGRL